MRPFLSAALISILFSFTTLVSAAAIPSSSKTTSAVSSVSTVSSSAYRLLNGTILGNATDTDGAQQFYDAYFAGKNITAFNAETKGWNNNSIASWFRTNISTDATNGHSWCYFEYNDQVPGIAISLGTMLNNTGGDAFAARRRFCGLEVELLSPRSNTTSVFYVIDAFDDKWVRTPNSIDVVKGVFPQIWGTETDNKNDVVQNLSWRFTGRKQFRYMFNSQTSLTPSTPFWKNMTDSTGKFITSTTSETSSSLSSSVSSNSSSPSTSQTSSNSSSSSSGTYSGTATYFYQKGNAGNCGTVHSDSDFIVALTSPMYASGSHCGETVEITGNGKTITATVSDSCPTCLSTEDLDLSESAFEALSDLNAGTVPISWSFV